MRNDNNKEKQKHMHKLNTTLETLNSKHLQNIIIYIDQPLKFMVSKRITRRGHEICGSLLDEGGEERFSME